MAKIKICGITDVKETRWLNEAGVEYAGFVLYEKSKRFIPILKAKEILKKLNSNIRKIAVVVSPDRKKMEEIRDAGFDAVQIHGIFNREALTGYDIPVWRAVHLSGIRELSKGRTDWQDEIDLADAILLDAASYGSGKTFGWDGEQTADGNDVLQREIRRFRSCLRAERKELVLAGGLHAANVSRGIQLFAPDIVDVSSGVEQSGAGGKSREKIMEFVQAVRETEKAALYGETTESGWR